MGDIEEQERAEMKPDIGYCRKFLPGCAAALAAILLGQNAQAGSLGRLFFSPEQRTQLEQRRMHNEAAEARGDMQKKQESIPAAGEEESTASVLTVNGIVQSRRGARTVWINGVAQNADKSGERAPESLTVTVPGKQQAVRVKVGQKLILDVPAQPGSAGQKPAEAEQTGAGGEDD